MKRERHPYRLEVVDQEWFPSRSDRDDVERFEAPLGLWKTFGDWAPNVRDLLGETSVGPAMNGSVYDTAWLADLEDPEQPGQSRYPKCLQWLAERQLPDGSWGSAVHYGHDRVVNTLAALVPLARLGHRATDRDSVGRGTRYLWQHAHLIAHEPVELVAYELLLPMLVDRAKRAGLPMPPNLDRSGERRAEKLRLLPLDRLYSPHTTASHSLEFLGEDASSPGLLAAQGKNGSIGNSPAATAFLLSRINDRSAQAYLNDSLAQGGGTSAPVLHPCETFELLWAAYPLYLSGVPAHVLLTPAERRLLRLAVDGSGVSLSPTFPIADADDTAVALILLVASGEAPNPAVLERFARPEGHFASFPHERHSSVGVNLHVLHAVLRAPDFPNRSGVIAHLLEYLLERQTDGLYWFDKWHISPYYATAHALRVFAELPLAEYRLVLPAVRRSREWIRQTAGNGGLWGFYGEPTAEETACAILGLTAPSRDDSEDWRCCAAADQYLKAVLLSRALGTGPSFPALWVDKCLYAPNLIIRATLAAARLAYRLASERATCHVQLFPRH